MQRTKAYCSICTQRILRQVKNFQGRHHNDSPSKLCYVIRPDTAILQYQLSDASVQL